MPGPLRHTTPAPVPGHQPRVAHWRGGYFGAWALRSPTRSPTAGVKPPADGQPHVRDGVGRRMTSPLDNIQICPTITDEQRHVTDPAAVPLPTASPWVRDGLGRRFPLLTYCAGCALPDQGVCRGLRVPIPGAARISRPTGVPRPPEGKGRQLELDRRMRAAFAVFQKWGGCTLASHAARSVLSLAVFSLEAEGAVGTGGCREGEGRHPGPP